MQQTIIMENTTMLKHASFASFAASTLSGVATFMNENAGAIGAAASILSLMVGIGFAWANLRINRKRLENSQKRRRETDQ